jgi:hypothetical protein
MYFTAGKKIRLTLYGSITTAATPGNLVIKIYFGNTDANTTVLATGSAMALVASQTTIPFIITVQAVSRGGAVPTATPVLAYSTQFLVPVALITAANQVPMIPAATPTAVNIDNTQALGFNVQFNRSGSTAETATVHDITFEALN